MDVINSFLNLVAPPFTFLESEATKGKFVMGQGKVEVDQDLRDVEVSAVPVGSASECAKAIVKSVARGERYLTVPGWFKMLVEWGLRLMYITGDSAKEAYSKKILDSSGAKTD